jgi:hypothetical protein
MEESPPGVEVAEEQAGRGPRPGTRLNPPDASTGTVASTYLPQKPSPRNHFGLIPRPSPHATILICEA